MIIIPKLEPEKGWGRRKVPDRSDPQVAVTKLSLRSFICGGTKGSFFRLEEPQSTNSYKNIRKTIQINQPALCTVRIDVKKGTL